MNRLTGLTDAMVHSTSYAYDAIGNLTRAAETLYGLDSGTNSGFSDREPRTTSYAYTWFSGTNRVQSVTVTEPTVSSTQNGPGSADNSSTVFDIHGRAIWHKDQAGFLQYTAYDTVSGAVIKRITDVNTSQTSDFSSLPSGWSTPSGGGLHLIDTWQVDALGRQVLWVNPRGDSTWTVYNDASHEVRIYHGWSSTSHTAVGPTEVYREYRPASGASSGQRYVYFETLTTSATPT
jgi:YD repeat-containing protein